MIIGIGLDVNLKGEDFPPEIKKLATSLRIELGSTSLSSAPRNRIHSPRARAMPPSPFQRCATSAFPRTCKAAIAVARRSRRVAPSASPAK